MPAAGKRGKNHLSDKGRAAIRAANKRRAEKNRRERIPPGEHQAHITDVKVEDDQLRATVQLDGPPIGRHFDHVIVDDLRDLESRSIDAFNAVARYRSDWLNAKATLDGLDERHEDYLSAVSGVMVAFGKYLRAAKAFRQITTVNADARGA